MGETPKREHSVQRRQEDHNQSQHLTTSMMSVFDWLTSLRISAEDAQEYTEALLALGFDDVQSLCEDATQDDLHQAGMKQGHVRRVFRALRAQQGAPSVATAARAGVDHTTTTRKNSNHNSSDARAIPGRNIDGAHSSSIFVGPRRNCVVMYEDDNGGWRRLDGHLGGTAADDGSSGCIAVSAGSGIPRGREGAGNHDGLSASSLSRSHEDLDPPDDYLGKEETTLDGEPMEINGKQKQSPSKSHAWPACAPGHGAALPKPRPRAPTMGDSAAAPAAAAPEISEGNVPPGEAVTVRSEGGGSPRVVRGGLNSPAAAAVRAYRSMPIVGQGQNFELSGLRFCQGGGGGRGGGGGGGGRRGGGSGGVDESRSSGTGSDLVSEDLGLELSSEGSSVEAALARSTKNQPTAGASCGGSKPHQGRLGLRRRLSLDGCTAGESEGGGAAEQDPNRSQPLRMFELTSAPGSDAATNTGQPLLWTFPDGLDPVEKCSLDEGNRASAPIRRRAKFYFSGGARSMSSIDTGAAAGPRPRTPQDNRHVFLDRNDAAPFAKVAGPPGKMERASSVQAPPGTEGDHGEVFGRGGHVKTLQRIRSTGRVRASCARFAEQLLLTRSGGECSRPSSGGRANDSKHSSTSQQPVALAAAAGEVEDSADAPVDIGMNLEEADDGLVVGPLSLEDENGSPVSIDAEVGQKGAQLPDYERGQRGASMPPSGALHGTSGIGGLSLELPTLQEQAIGDGEQSYEFSDNGTLHIQGFVFKPDGMKSAPTPKNAGITDSRKSASRGSNEDSIRSLRPPALQTTFPSEGRTPCSRESSFGGAVGGRGVGAGSSGPPQPPTLTTTTPRRTRETTILLEEIGRGGGGTVHRAMHVPSMRLVAVKMVEVHDDDKRRQMIQELKALLSMNRVPLTSPGLAGSEYGGGNSNSNSNGLGYAWDGWNFGSSECSSSGSWSNDDSSPKREEEGSGVEGYDCLSGTDGTPTSTTATATVTPSSRSGGGGGLSSRGGTPSSQATQQLSSGGVGGAGEGRQPPASGGAGGGGSDQGSRALDSRPGSTCGFAPGSRGSGGIGSTGGLFGRPCGGAAARGDGHNLYTNNGLAAAGQRQRRRHVGGGGSGGGSGSGGRHHSPPVIAFHDAYTDMERGRVCIVMEYMDGGTLQQFVTRREVLPEPALAAVARSVLRGLADMHAKRQIHRDIKPSNILLDRQGRVKISDFGVVRELNQTGSLAKTFTGTLTYMSPERITETNYSYASDIWSLGMVIAALALGRFPLATRGGYFEVLKAITEDPVPALSPESFSKELCGFVELMLRRDPAERPNARTLLGHPFLMMHKGCHKLVGMVKVAPATGVEVQSLLKKVVDYHLDERATSSGKDTPPFGGCSPVQPTLPFLQKANVDVLAAQLQVTRTELVEEYEHLRKQGSEKGLLGGEKLPHGTRPYRRVDLAPVTPHATAVTPRAPRLRPVPSPNRLEIVATGRPSRHGSETPPAMRSPLSAASGDAACGRRTGRRAVGGGGTPTSSLSRASRSPAACQSGKELKAGSPTGRPAIE